MFCIECGKEDEKLFKGLCRSCFASDNKVIIIPPEVEVEVCAHCSAVHVEGKWLDTEQSEEEIIAETIASASVPDKDAEDIVLEIDLINQKGSVFEILVNASGKVKGVPVKREYSTKVKLNRNTCPNCSKYASGYYEAVLQLRAHERQLESDEIQKADEIIKQSLDKLYHNNRMAYLSQRLELKEGIDYYFGSLKTARKISNTLKDEMGGVMKESPRLMGRDKSAGKDLYRTWISLRLPFFQKGDFLSLDNHVGRVIDSTGKKIIICDLITQENISVSWRKYSNLELLANSADVKNTTISSKSPSEIQLLHPETYQPVDLDMTSQLSYLNIGDQVEVVEIRKKLYILPK
ncbi:MAG: NMD protein affecting ribosome stability and mRNA decay [Methanobacteriaceae archaeon]|nr:NMD protein affecting ribosome stability and mRNA decay [Methanobacteriaceae archaeon]